jgi:hypothetical protein
MYYHYLWFINEEREFKTLNALPNVTQQISSRARTVTHVCQRTEQTFLPSMLLRLSVEV